MKLFEITFSYISRKGNRKIRKQRAYAWDTMEAYKGWHMYSKDTDELISIVQVGGAK